MFSDRQISLSLGSVNNYSSLRSCVVYCKYGSNLTPDASDVK